ncbi:CSE2-domain-containing protein [Terfezia boudieri ATCC MYA-4762]|uniref:Mediator of RNA polymerase II transcription subunit 21 n=1 Tax=Terfezia boudieri ATCC MYA-4762 TaxID=1051890 RepID=A0A3N4M517_9PEZI|nr:CSE2-domain-containing protein [Terfezia boudieri ATCC MYA-4762]
MADRLTQLQDALDQATTQFYCAIRYISTRHEPIALGKEPTVKDENVTPDDPATFEIAKAELAKDLIMKSKQIELLICSLPGIGVSEVEQQQKLRSLEKELQEAEAERKQAVEEKEDMVERLDTVIRSIRRV